MVCDKAKREITQGHLPAQALHMHHISTSRLIIHSGMIDQAFKSQRNKRM
uniref:Uncharacterized protein n=1 Tax=Setaria italica TaxID=4555 RepID=K3YNP6_SETIT